jgi:hypothetical protein
LLLTNGFQRFPLLVAELARFFGELPEPLGFPTGRLIS